MSMEHWFDLGIPTGLDQMALMPNADGRLELFVLGDGRELWHTWQTMPNSGWSDWASLGRIPGDAPKRDELVVGHYLDGTLQVFGKGIGRVQGLVGSTGDRIAQISQNVPNGGWGNWRFITDPVYRAEYLSLGENLDGRLELFFFEGGPEPSLWHKWQSAPNKVWQSKEKLILPPESDAPFGLNPILSSNGDLNLLAVMLFMGSFIESGLSIMRLRQEGGWTKWTNLGIPEPLVGKSLRITVAGNADGRIEIFARSSDYPTLDIFHKWEIGQGGWSDWENLGMPIKPPIKAGPDVKWYGDAFCLAKNADGRLELFASGLDGALWHRWQILPQWHTTSENAWSEWDTLGGEKVDKIVTATNPDGRIEVFIFSYGNGLFHRWQVNPGRNEWNN